jgi:hypothetical protein
MFRPRAVAGAAVCILGFSLTFSKALYAQGLLASPDPEAGSSSTNSLNVPAQPARCDSEPVGAAFRVSPAKAPSDGRSASASDSASPAPCISQLPASAMKKVCALRGLTDGGCSALEDPPGVRLLALGKPGSTIARARAMVLGILQSENACSAWYREKDPDPAGTFQTLEFDVDTRGPSYIVESDFNPSLGLYWHPYVAMSAENAGPGATIKLNANGAFFHSDAAVRRSSREGGPTRAGGIRELKIDSYVGDTLPAQITALLHELGHITGRIPPDPDKTDGMSGRNTAEVLRNCRAEVESAAQHPLRLASR